MEKSPHRNCQWIHGLKHGGGGGERGARPLEGCRKGGWTLERRGEPLGIGSVGQVPGVEPLSGKQAVHAWSPAGGLARARTHRPQQRLTSEEAAVEGLVNRQPDGSLGLSAQAPWARSKRNVGMKRGRGKRVSTF